VRGHRRPFVYEPYRVCGLSDQVRAAAGRATNVQVCTGTKGPMRDRKRRLGPGMAHPVRLVLFASLRFRFCEGEGPYRA